MRSATEARQAISITATASPRGAPRDLNNFYYETDVDDLGRVTGVRGPNELATGVPYIIPFEYSPKAEFTANDITARICHDESTTTSSIQTMTWKPSPSWTASVGPCR